MLFNTGAALLDAIVLAVVAREPEGTYGYKITQEVRQVIELSESTLYPVLRRLETSGALRVYSIEHNGRLRKYYAITDEGRQKIQAFLQEWEAVMKVYEFIRRDEA